MCPILENYNQFMFKGAPCLNHRCWSAQLMYLELIRLKNIELVTGCQQIADIAGDLFDFTKNVTEVI